MIPPPVFSKPPELQFRAGRMKYAAGTVTADKRKGHLTFFSSGARAVEMIWASEAEKSAPIVLPRGKTTVSFVEQCKTGRVLLFEVTENGEKKHHFFWLQDKSEQKDNVYLATLESMLAERTITSHPKTTVDIADFKKILANVSKAKKDVKLSDVLSSSTVTEELNSSAAFYKAKLAEHLPKDGGESGDLVSQVKNPQVSQAAAMLEAALQDPATYKQLCVSFGIPETDPNGGVLAFLNGIIAAAKKP
ncbi:Proteasome complex subunit Rpn13 ubiquitin receptor [Novymonas esmeraldas]|uniref:Proteasome complex subunit Rpn13 ubiquitin receptor n=1 Tax=Novymonas esmeraldas TaxID=1808958 RepID=A0AAW0ETP6_9TRYP